MKWATAYMVVGVTILAASGENLHAGNYEFRTIVSVFSTIDGITIGSPFSPTMNSNRDVVFKAGICSSPPPGCAPVSEVAIFTPHAMLVRQGDTIGGVTLAKDRSLGRPAINDNGLIVFSGISVVERAEFGGIFSLAFLLHGGPLTIEGKTENVLQAPAINNNNGGLIFVTGQDRAIATLEGFIVESGDTIEGITINQTSEPAINDNGDVVFVGRLENDQAEFGIFTPEHFLVGAGSVVDGKTLQRAFSPALNNNGDLIYIGFYEEEGGSGVFTLDRMLVGTGDDINGKTLRDIGGAGLSLNDDGAFVFSARFTDGTAEIILATPRPDSDGDGVPDPEDTCPDTHIPEPVPTQRLKVGRFALTDNDAIFDTRSSRKVFTTADTAGCSCAQIINELDLSKSSRRDQRRFGCLLSTMRRWIRIVNP